MDIASAVSPGGKSPIPRRVPVPLAAPSAAGTRSLLMAVSTSASSADSRRSRRSLALRRLLVGPMAGEADAKDDGEAWPQRGQRATPAERPRLLAQAREHLDREASAWVELRKDARA